ncbi:phage tail assembly chaperone [Acinetobacter rathckeae]|uniref:phage tail assembly chaperone n=1 Tax=Acinetobacter rathckeae TaxID=2605272 RepID=UPI0018A255A0|nr:hypothetical protein [Acinetobacter rathckeae]MBF7687081.1 hypothetical protein [Acinetobacter rathckeae]
MEVLNIGGHKYTISKLNAFDQLHVSRKIAPLTPHIIPVISEVMHGGLVKALQKIDSDIDVSQIDVKNIDDLINNVDFKLLDGLSTALSPLTKAYAELPQEDVDYVIYKCLSACSRNGAKVCRNNAIMFDDLELSQMLALVVAVIRDSMGNFIQGLFTKARALQEQST